MIQKEFYDIIAKRKSVRKYDMTPLNEHKINEIEEFTKLIKPLNLDISTKFVFLSSGDVKNLLPVKAPHYLCIYSDKKEGYLTNAGFMLQQADLYLSKNGIGSCWLGVAKPTNAVPRVIDNLEFVIMLSFGNPIDSLHRESVEQYKRKSLQEVTSILENDEIMEPIRLAPSASNSQPWFISGEKEHLVFNREKLSLLRAPIYDKMNCIDIGIALCHLWIAAIKHDKNVDFIYDSKDSKLTPDKYIYMMSAKIY